MGHDYDLQHGASTFSIIISKTLVKKQGVRCIDIGNLSIQVIRYFNIAKHNLLTLEVTNKIYAEFQWQSGKNK